MEKNKIAADILKEVQAFKLKMIVSLADII